jgi:hypothetical protein
MYERGVPGGALNLNSTGYQHQSLWGSSPARENSHSRTGNRTWDLMASKQKFWPPSHEVSHIRQKFIRIFWVIWSMLLIYIYKVCGSCKTFFCSFRCNKTTKTSTHGNLIFEKPAVQNKSRISCCQNSFTLLTKTIPFYTITLGTSSALTSSLWYVKLLTGYGSSSSNHTGFSICL